MATNPSAPLTEEHYAQLKNALDIAEQTRMQIAKAKQAGIDVSQLEQQLADTEGRIRQIKNVYFPGR